MGHGECYQVLASQERTMLLVPAGGAVVKVTVMLVASADQNLLPAASADFARSETFSGIIISP